MLLHHLQELDDDLGARADHDLALASLLGVVDGLERIVEDGCFDHDGGSEILRARIAARGICMKCILLAFKSHASAKSALWCSERAHTKGSSARPCEDQARRYRRHCGRRA